MTSCVRHGETEWSRDERHTGRTDIPLTDDGREQALVAGRRLAGPRVRARAHQPAAARPRDRARWPASPSRADDDLMEWDYGDVEGRTTDEIREAAGLGHLARRPGRAARRWTQVGARADRVIARVRRARRRRRPLRPRPPAARARRALDRRSLPELGRAAAAGDRFASASSVASASTASSAAGTYGHYASPAATGPTAPTLRVLRCPLRARGARRRRSTTAPDAQPAQTILTGQGLLESVIGGPGRQALLHRHRQEGAGAPRRAGRRAGRRGRRHRVARRPAGRARRRVDRRRATATASSQGAVGNLIGLAGPAARRPRHRREDDDRDRHRRCPTASRATRPASSTPPTTSGTGIDRVVGDKVQRNWATRRRRATASRSAPTAATCSSTRPSSRRRSSASTSPIRRGRASTPRPGRPTSPPGLDGLTIDQRRPAVRRRQRVRRDLADRHRQRRSARSRAGSSMPSAVAFGAGGAFPVTSLYAVTFGGDVVEIPQVRTAPRAPAAAPRRGCACASGRGMLRARARTRVKVTVRRGPRPRAARAGPRRQKVKRTRANGAHERASAPARAGSCACGRAPPACRRSRERIRVARALERPSGVVESYGAASRSGPSSSRPGLVDARVRGRRGHAVGVERAGTARARRRATASGDSHAASASGPGRITGMRSCSRATTGVGRAGQHRRAREPLALGLGPAPQPGERERLAAVDREAERDARRLLVLRAQPLVEAVGEDQAAAARLGEQVLERALRRRSSPSAR